MAQEVTPHIRIQLYEERIKETDVYRLLQCFCEDHFGSFMFILCSFLTKSKKEMELRKWAAEGLSFLTMDADVKVLRNKQFVSSKKNERLIYT